MPAGELRHVLNAQLLVYRAHAGAVSETDFLEAADAIESGGAASRLLGWTALTRFGRADVAENLLADAARFDSGLEMERRWTHDYASELVQRAN